MTLQTVKVLRLCLKNELRLADGRQRCSRQTVGFAQINAYMTDGRILPEPPVSERMRVMVNHVKKYANIRAKNRHKGSP